MKHLRHVDTGLEAIFDQYDPITLYLTSVRFMFNIKIYIYIGCALGSPSKRTPVATPFGEGFQVIQVQSAAAPACGLLFYAVKAQGLID